MARAVRMNIWQPDALRSIFEIFEERRWFPIIEEARFLLHNYIQDLGLKFRKIRFGHKRDVELVVRYDFFEPPRIVSRLQQRELL